jgi:hypothetical protein
MDTHTSSQQHKVTKLHSYGSVKKYFSIAEEMAVADLLFFIHQAALMLKKQKEYFSCKDAEMRKQKLIECKQLENRIRQEGNRIFLKYSGKV